MDARVKVGDSALNTCRFMLSSSPTAPVLRTFVQDWIALSSRPQPADDTISRQFVRLAIADQRVYFHVIRLNRSPEIRPEGVGGGIVDRFLKLR